MHVAFSVADCHAHCAVWRAEGKTIALVPTMGALHEGHLALIRSAKALADRVVVSIFVNPLQFTTGDDFLNYPRVMTSDLDHCEALGVDIVFTPSEKEMYPASDDLTKIIPPAELTDRLCGLSRPGHFTGVATVVAKLFHIVEPTMAVFGEKDAQQLAVIRRMVRDLDLPVEIVPHDTVRDDRGLALSSRNRRLQTPAEIEASYALSAVLNRAAEKIATGTAAADPHVVFAQALEETLSTLSPQARALFDLDYLEAVDAVTFEPAETLRPGVKLLVAAHIKTATGDVRLIDNRNA